MLLGNRIGIPVTCNGELLMNRHSNRPRYLRPALAAAVLSALLSGPVSVAKADVKLPAIFGSHLVLQRDQKDKVWGWAAPDEAVTVEIAGQSKSATAGSDGAWQVVLDPMPAGGPYTMTVR